MKVKKLLVIFGTRPEAIKVAPIIQAAKSSSQLECVVAVTGQHRELLDQVITLFGVVPDFDLDVFTKEQSLNRLVARIINGLDGVFDACEPDAVLVQGDTTSAVAGAIAAFYRGIPVVHAEAGLRSYNLYSPFPEEANRKVASQLATLHLAPTMFNKRNLMNEGVSEKDIVVTGNTVIDALLETLSEEISFSDRRLKDLEASGRRIVTVTTHRRENHGKRMASIANAISVIAKSASDTDFVLPLHWNPAVRDLIIPATLGLSNVIVTDPLNYAEFTKLLSLSSVVLTDSGGVQEEAPSLGKPVLVMRSNTERPEGIVAGSVKLVGTDTEDIVREMLILLKDQGAYNSMATAVNPYGDGHASLRSIEAIKELLGVGRRSEEFSSWNPSEDQLVRAAQMIH
ncbi:non-hydrolyzing UDP-N-acetylglucosamine 2-epimerase [Glutamicibacter sp. HZAU]|uniref:non-hydrolyzing UDP-N-acetylglucosamine 2-epimerase n=1 Tax=Glutamicibacter sp. HZAU TaxID=2049891 RepID=UPI000FFB08E8|nr:UDP-N-acetylglucosamine 2-epimerase (non-hydrolyzing) [Glutamicibacter sp. HZAU]RWZ83799.1 UDP-N-acetylglucosamine 2-epimerase (non-hydrolyzing) [Glutamicibacter sp. HZAU]